MRSGVGNVFLAGLLCVAGIAFGQPTDQPDPLFRSDAVLDVQISAPLETLMRERPETEDLAGELSFADSDGTLRNVSVGLQTRGNYRRQRDVCPFAPVRLNLKKSEVKDTLFDKQDKLKLVTHCKNRSDRYQQGVFREYLSYRILNLLTDASFRVRLLRINWQDTENLDDELQTYGFVIEHDERFAKRTNLPELDISRTRVEYLDPGYTNLTSVFQYLIGNTDYSPIAGAKGETCCHNATLFGEEEVRVFAVPYDFDMSGMVNAKYATPNPRFDIRSVRDRLYRGRCAFNSELPETLGNLKQNKAAIYALMDEIPQLDSRSLNEVRRFMDSFFDVIEDPKRVKREFEDECLS